MEEDEELEEEEEELEKDEQFEEEVEDKEENEEDQEDNGDDDEKDEEEEDKEENLEDQEENDDDDDDEEDKEENEEDQEDNDDEEEEEASPFLQIKNFEKVELNFFVQKNVSEETTDGKLSAANFLLLSARSAMYICIISRLLVYTKQSPMLLKMFNVEARITVVQRHLEGHLEQQVS